MKYIHIGVGNHTARRSPCGERGLKFEAVGVLDGVEASLPVRGAWIEIPERPDAGRSREPSLPVRGAWIEINRVGLRLLEAQSLPVRGAWIEISRPVTASGRRMSRSPCGERGLK